MLDESTSAQVLLEESKLAADMSERRYASSSQFGAIAIAVIAAAAGLASEAGRELIFLAAPLVLTIISSILVQLFADALAINYYHGRLQDRLNTYLRPADRLHYQAVVNKRVYWSIPIVQLLLVALTGASYALAGITAIHSGSYHVQILVYYGTILALGVAALVAGVRDVLTSEGQAKRLYEAALQPDE
jgi:hypothetical protein